MQSQALPPSHSLLLSSKDHPTTKKTAGATHLPFCYFIKYQPFRGTKPTRTFTTSPPMMRPATDGTKALEPGTERRMVHLRWVPGGQMQCC